VGVDSNMEEITKKFIESCESKNYKVKLSEKSNYTRLEISDLKNRVYINIYNTGTVQVQGKESPLKTEITELKERYIADPLSFIDSIQDIKACSTKYDIIISEDRDKIKDSLDQIECTLEINENPEKIIEYRAKLTRNKMVITLTQYENGTLLLQGKENRIFEECCDFIEKLANPAEKGVIARFLSNDEKLLELFNAKYTPKLLEISENNVIAKLGKVYKYLKPYHQKWFIASECLKITNIPLPEFSPIIMPASKAFEGFAKKLLVDIQLVGPDYFKKKSAGFSCLKNKTDPKRKALCKKEKYVDSMLERLNIALQFLRHHIMHSDESKLTKVESREDAEKRLSKIYEETKEIFEYFDDLFNLI